MKLKIEYISTEELKTYANNAKIHTDEQIEQIKISIREFGFNDPIAVWKNNEIIEGHGRLIAATELGMDQVPIIRLDGLSDEERRAYMLVHNKLTMDTGFDLDILNLELDDIVDIDMEQFGFDISLDEESAEIIEDEIPEDVESRCKLGDLWKLGEHRLICGDSTDVTVIDRLMDALKNKYKALFIWNKGNHTLSNSDYMSKYEPIVYGWFNEHNFYGDRSNFDIWDIERTKKNDLHPTMKPISLVAHAIDRSSKREQIVLDLFGGSGSTLIACEQLNRKCYMAELDERYVSVIVNRWLNFTGRKDEIFCIRDGQRLTYEEVFGG